MTPMEGKSLLRGSILLFAIASMRVAVECSRTTEVAMGERPDDLDHLLEDARAARDEEARRSAPLAPGETIDPNRAGEEELDRLPGVGPSVARALLDEREGGGGFMEAEDLLRVRGIGPATLAKIRPYLDFSRGVPLDQRPAPTADRVLPGPAGAEELASRRSSVIRRGSPPSRIDVNRAPAGELESLPGIGPALAARIVESRGRDGPFRKAEDLLRVRGIGPAILARIRRLILPDA